MTVFHSVHWFFSLVQTALKKIIAWDAPFTPCYFSPYNLTHHWFYILRAVVDLFSLKNPWKLFHHEINYENIRAYLFLRETNNSLSQMSNLVIFFFNFIWIMCRLFSRTRMLKHCKHVIWSDTWQRVWPVQLPSDMP